MLHAPVGFLPQQITSSIEHESNAALIDTWGRSHPVSTSTLIGRVIAGPGVTILDAGISRVHARLSLTQSGWRLLDLGSSNGTFVNGDKITDRDVRSGDIVFFGAVSFYFWLGVEPLRRPPMPELSTHIKPVERASSPRSLPISLFQPSGGGGGVIAVANVRARLSRSQLELVEVLARRMIAEKNQPELVRGFVRSSELLGTLSWDTTTPDDSSLKQLVRRARRRLQELGFGDLIESRHGFGYRLRWDPTPAFGDELDVQAPR